MMKRMILPLILVIALAAMPALAEADQPILFRGLEWGASCDEVFASLLESGLAVDEDPYRADTSESSFLYPVFDEFFPDYPFPSFPEVESFPVQTVYFSLADGAQVAGYPLAQLRTKFYAGVQNGCVVQDSALNHFYYAEYVFDHHGIADIPGAYSAIVGKLTGLYGEPFLADTTESGSSRSVWRGADGTYIFFTSSSAMMRLRYGTLYVEPWLAAIANPETSVDPDSTDGL